MRRGYSATVLEAAEKPGGMMRWGIPGYRLPEAVLDCGDAAGYALAALRTGVKIIRFSGKPSAAMKIRDIAGTYGARLVRRPSRILDPRGAQDADKALRKWLDHQ